MSYQPKSNRKFYATALTSAVVASAVAPAAVSADHVFEDVQDDNYYSEAVQHLAGQAILQGPGDGNFHPSDDINRAAAAEVLMKAQNISADGTEDFSDVDADDWYYNAVRATSPAIFQGNGSGLFSPDRELTRQEAAAIIVRAYELIGGESHPFTDVQDGGWADDAIAVAYENGIIQGTGNNEFKPLDKVSRADFAVMVYRAMGLGDGESITVENTTVIDANTIQVTLSNDETAEVSLEEALVNGENDVTFEVDGIEFSATVDYDAVTPAIEAAEEAIAELPEELTLEDAEAVASARSLVDAALELDENAEITGLDTLVAAEEIIVALEAVVTAEESLLEEDLAAAQALVDELSDSDDKTQLNTRLSDVQTQLDSIIGAVNDAKGELALYRALDVQPFENVNEDYIEAYETAITEYITENGDFETVAAIQEVVDTENDFLNIVQPVIDAENQVELYNALTANFDSVVEANIADYDGAIVDPATVAEVQYAIDFVNAENSISNFTVDADTTQADLDELKALVPVTGEDQEGNAIATDEEQALLNDVADYQTAFDELTEASEGLAEAVTAAETAQDAYVAAGGDVEDTVYTDVTTELEDAEAVDFDSASALTTATTELTTETGELETATEDLIVLNEAVANAEAAQDAYVAVGGDVEATVYTDLETELEAETPDTITTATDALEAETAELELVASINDATTAEELEAALVNLENSTYNNLSNTQRLEVADWFLTTVAEQDPAFETSSNISAALDTEIAGYQDLIADVNTASSITTTDEALEALTIEEYEALSAAEQLDAAENVMNAQPEGGYTSISSIVANF